MPAPVCAAPPSWGRHPQTFTQTDYLAFRQIKLCGKNLSVQIELSLEFPARQQAADGVDVR